jgi:hypothetical protein
MGTVWPGGQGTPTPVGVTRDVPVLYLDSIPVLCSCPWGYSDHRQMFRRCWPAARCPVHGNPDALAQEAGDSEHD